MELGLFTQPDKLGVYGSHLEGESATGGSFDPLNISLYAYTHWSPVKYTDPTGEDIVIMVDKQGAYKAGHTAFLIISPLDSTLNKYAGRVSGLEGQIYYAKYFSFESVGGVYHIMVI
jgi:hypothetical protein